MENENNHEFLKQFGGSATANLVTAILFMLYKFVEGHCRHSKCSSDNSCFKCSADNYSTSRASSPPKTKDVVRTEAEESLPKVHAGVDRQVQTRRPPLIEIREPESRDHSREFSLVKGRDLV